MAFLTIKTDNKNLSYVLVKNPVAMRQTGNPFEKKIRKGRAYGWFSEDDTKFSLLFIDSPVESSFGNRQEFEYLDQSRYINPYVPIMLITDCLNSALSDENELDVPGQAVVTTAIACPTRIMDRFLKMPGYAAERMGKDLFKVTITDSTIKEVLNRTIALCVIATIVDKDTYIPLPEEGVAKYLRVLNRIDCPYYLRHLFVSMAITNRNLFEKLETEINRPGLKMVYGNTQVQRHISLSTVLQDKRGDTLIDIGCGELYHTLRLGKEYPYVLAVESDEAIFGHARRLVEKKGIENITVQNATASPEWVKESEGSFSNADVIISEVLEHMEEKAAEDLLLAVLNTDFNKVVVTMPNGEFNRFYGIEGSMRHDDHKWEPTEKDYFDFVQKVLKKVSYEPNKLGAVTVRVGDQVAEGDRIFSPTFQTTFSRI